MNGEIFVNTAEARNKMILECAYMARSAALHQCIPVGTSWKSTSLACLNSLSNLEHSLSSRWRGGFKLEVHNHLWRIA
jgi:hypothetical protein